MAEQGLDRRRVLCGIAGAGLIAAALAACSDSDSGDDSKDSSKPSEAQTSAGKTVLAQTSAVAVGSGVVVNAPDGAPIVVVQPEQGTFKAFSAKCTHQGTTVNAPVDDVITCPNHGSQFSASDGSVERGPATRPLPEVSITVEGSSILLA